MGRGRGRPHPLQCGLGASPAGVQVPRLCAPPSSTVRHGLPAPSVRRGNAIAAKAKEEKIELEGEVIEALRNGFFKIALENGHETLGYTAGKMRRFRIRIFPGDRIKIELSPYDLTRGRIVYRYR